MIISICGDEPTGEGVTHELLKDAAKFCLDILYSDQPINVTSNLVVEIDTRIGMRDKYNMDGGLDWDDKPYPQLPTDFFISLDSHQPIEVAVMSIAHELAHVKQMHLGWKIQDPSGEWWMWNGKFIDVENTHYYDLPWERDAHGFELGAWARYSDHLNGYQRNASSDELIRMAKAKITNNLNLGFGSKRRQ